MKVSVCIPTYEMRGEGARFLEESFNVLASQTFTDFEVIVSDNSADHAIREVCEKWKSLLDLHYFQRTERLDNPCANLNNAISHSSGEYIKPLFLDDRLYTKNSLLKFVEAANKTSPGWVISGGVYTSGESRSGIHAKRKRPFFHTKNLTGTNFVGMPSVIMFKNEGLLFDEKLVWLLDTEFYHRLYLRYNNPIVIPDYLIVQREWPGSLTSSMTVEIMDKETAYVKKKHADTFPLGQNKSAFYRLWLSILTLLGR